VFPTETACLRVETGIREGDAVTQYYDPLLAKIIVLGEDRAAALARLDDALAGTQIDLVGPRGQAHTNLEFLREVLHVTAFRSGIHDTRLAEQLATTRKAKPS